jgi:hypothetical protein
MKSEQNESMNHQFAMRRALAMNMYTTMCERIRCVCVCMYVEYILVQVA